MTLLGPYKWDQFGPHKWDLTGTTQGQLIRVVILTSQMGPSWDLTGTLQMGPVWDHTNGTLLGPHRDNSSVRFGEPHKWDLTGTTQGPLICKVRFSCPIWDLLSYL